MLEIKPFDVVKNTTSDVEGTVLCVTKTGKEFAVLWFDGEVDAYSVQDSSIENTGRSMYENVEKILNDLFGEK